MRIEVKQFTQRPWNKSIPVEVVVVPDKAYDVLEVRVRGGTYKGIEVKPTYRKLRNVVSDKQYVFRFSIKPNFGGEYRVSFTVLGNYKGNVTARSVDTQLRLNRELVKVPVDPGYNKLLVGYYSVLVGGLILVGVLLYLSYKKWLRRPLLEWYRRQTSPTFK